MKAPISVCYITKGEPHLAASIASVRPWVEEINVLYTAKDWPVCDLIDHSEYMEWTDDFSAARNASFAMATRPWILWLDSDDVLDGGAWLAGIVEELQRPGGPAWAWMPYEYEHESDGSVKCLLPKPRIVSRGDFAWVFAVHEELKPVNEVNVRIDLTPHSVHAPRVVHHRTPTEARAATQRNIRILRRELEKNPNDTRSLFYLGCALFDAREFEASEVAFSDLLRAGGPDDQRSLALRRMAVIRELRGELQPALMLAVASITENPVAESYFAVARIHRAAAEQGGPGAKREWEKVRHFTEVGLSLPETRGGLWVNPMERGFYAREMLAHAYAELGDKRRAVECAESALLVREYDELRDLVAWWSADLPPLEPTKLVKRGYAGFEP